MRISTAAAVTLFGAALIAVGTLGPWIDTVLVSRSGLSTSDGKLVGAIGVLVALLALQSRGVGLGGRIVIVLLGALAGLVGFIDLADITDRTSDNEFAGPGWGLYAVIGGGIITAVSGFNSSWKRREQ